MCRLLTPIVDVGETGSVRQKAACTSILLSPLGNAFAADAPVVHVHFVNHDHGGFGIFVQYARQQIGYAGDEFGFLFRAWGFAAAGYFKGLS